MITLYIFILLAGCVLYVSEALYYDYGGERSSFEPNKTTIDQYVSAQQLPFVHSPSLPSFSQDS